MYGRIMIVWTYTQLQEVIQQAINKHKEIDAGLELLFVFVLVLFLVGFKLLTQSLCNLAIHQIHGCWSRSRSW